MVKSKITGKFQTTVTKEIREKPGLSVADELKWEAREGEIVIPTAGPDFLKRRGTIEEGPSPVDAVREMRRTRGGS